MGPLTPFLGGGGRMLLLCYALLCSAMLYSDTPCDKPRGAIDSDFSLLRKGNLVSKVEIYANSRCGYRIVSAPGGIESRPNRQKTRTKLPPPSRRPPLPSSPAYIPFYPFKKKLDHRKVAATAFCVFQRWQQGRRRKRSTPTRPFPPFPLSPLPPYPSSHPSLSNLTRITLQIIPRARQAPEIRGVTVIKKQSSSSAAFPPLHPSHFRPRSYRPPTPFSHPSQRRRLPRSSVHSPCLPLSPLQTTVLQVSRWCLGQRGRGWWGGRV